MDLSLRIRIENPRFECGAQVHAFEEARSSP